MIDNQPNDMLKEESNVAESLKQTETQMGEASSDFANYNEEKPKKKFPKAFLIGGVAALAIAGVATAGVFVFGKKNPTEQFKKAISDDAKAGSERAVKFYNKYMADLQEAKEGNNKATYSLELLDSNLKDSLNGLTTAFMGFDIGWLDSIGMTMDAVVKEGKMSSDIELFVNDKNAVSSKLYYGDEQLLFQLSDLSSDYLDFSSSTNGQLNLENLMNAQSAYADTLPEGKDLREIMDKYSVLWLEDIKNVTSEKSKVSAEGIEQNATKLSVSLGGEELLALYRKYLEEAKQDEILKEVFVTYYDNMFSSLQTMNGGEDGEAVFDKILSDFGEKLDSAEEDAEISLDMDIWVADGRIIAKKYVTNDGYNNVTIELKTPRKGTDIGVEMYLIGEVTDLDDEARKSGMELKGTAKYDHGKINGEFEATIDQALSGEEVDPIVFTINLKNWDWKAYEDGHLVFDIEVIPQESTASSDGMGVDFSNYSLNLSIDSTAKKGKTNFTLFEDEEEAVIFDVSYEYLGDADVEQPDGEILDTEDQDDILAYISAADWDAFFDKLKETDIPEEYIEALEGVIQLYR